MFWKTKKCIYKERYFNPGEFKMSPSNNVSSLDKELVAKIRHLYKNLYDCNELIKELQKQNEYLKNTCEMLNQPIKRTTHLYSLKN